jgi:hypothetical protein
VRAEQGDAKAQYRLGASYAYGEGVPKDYTEAVRWCRKAADQGDVDAQYVLSDMYRNGQACRGTTPRLCAGTAKSRLQVS